MWSGGRLGQTGEYWPSPKRAIETALCGCWQMRMWTHYWQISFYNEWWKTWEICWFLFLSTINYISMLWIQVRGLLAGEFCKTKRKRFFSIPFLCVNVSNYQNSKCTQNLSPGFLVVCGNFRDALEPATIEWAKLNPNLLLNYSVNSYLPLGKGNSTFCFTWSNVLGFFF